MSQFCRHNRFISECSICSKGTVLDSGRPAERRPRAASARPASGTRSRTGPVVARQSRGPFVSAGPYGSREVRLEKVPGGLRLASWLGGQLERSAPVLALADLPALVAAAAEQEIFGTTDAERVHDAFAAIATPGGTGEAPISDGSAHDRSGADGSAPAGFAADGSASAGDARSPSFGRSAGRSGDFKEELRVEAFDDGLVRVARWLMRPNRGWELQEAPVMLPAARFAQAFADAAQRGVLTAVQPTA